MRPLRAVAQRRPLLTFFTLALVFGWLLALPLVLSPAGLGVWSHQVSELWLILVACAPTAAALCTQRLGVNTWGIARLGSPWPRVTAGVALGLGVTLFAFAVVPALVLTNAALGALHWPALVTAAAPWWRNPLNLLGGPLNEEPGWRGFALPRLQARWGAVAASVILGLVWTLWHVPLFLLHGWLSVPIWAFAVLLVCLSVSMTWVTNWSRGSVLPAIGMHAVFNSSFPILVALCQGVPTRAPGLVWYVVGVAATTLVVVVLTRGRLGRVALVQAEAQWTPAA